MNQRRNYIKGREAFPGKFVQVMLLLCISLVLALAVSNRAEAAQTGFVVENGVGYYYDTNGQKHTGWLYYNGKRYLFDSNGRQMTGWQSSGRRYFKETAGVNGYMVTGLYQDGSGKVYYFRPTTGLYQRMGEFLRRKKIFFE